MNALHFLLPLVVLVLTSCATKQEKVVSTGPYSQCEAGLDHCKNLCTSQFLGESIGLLLAKGKGKSTFDPAVCGKICRDKNKACIAKVDEKKQEELDAKEAVAQRQREIESDRVAAIERKRQELAEREAKAKEKKERDEEIARPVFSMTDSKSGNGNTYNKADNRNSNNSASNPSANVTNKNSTVSSSNSSSNGPSSSNDNSITYDINSLGLKPTDIFIAVPFWWGYPNYFEVKYVVGDNIKETGEFLQNFHATTTALDTTKMAKCSDIEPVGKLYWMASVKVNVPPEGSMKKEDVATANIKVGVSCGKKTVKEAIAQAFERAWIDSGKSITSIQVVTGVNGKYEREQIYNISNVFIMPFVYLCGSNTKDKSWSSVNMQSPLGFADSMMKLCPLVPVYPGGGLVKGNLWNVPKNARADVFPKF